MLQAMYLQVAERVQEQKLDLTELEFGLLLQACARGGASWKQVQALLKRMSRELTRLQPETLAAAEQYFRYACTLCFDRSAILLHTHTCTWQDEGAAVYAAAHLARLLQARYLVLHAYCL